MEGDEEKAGREEEDQTIVRLRAIEEDREAEGELK